jgi:hypothetical protein
VHNSKITTNCVLHFYDFSIIFYDFFKFQDKHELTKIGRASSDSPIDFSAELMWIWIKKFKQNGKTWMFHELIEVLNFFKILKNSDKFSVDLFFLVEFLQCRLL